MPLVKDKGMKALMDMDKNFKKVMEKVLTNSFKIAVGNRGARGGSPNNQFILENFKKRWAGNQRTFEKLAKSTEDQKTDMGDPFFLVTSHASTGGQLMRSVRDTIRVKLVGNKVSAQVTVPDYGVFIQEGTLKMPARPFFTLNGVEKEFYGLIESQLTLEFNRLGIKSKENN